MDDYFKQLDMFLIRVHMDESEEAKIARFVSGLRRDIQDVVELCSVRVTGTSSCADLNRQLGTPSHGLPVGGSP